MLRTDDLDYHLPPDLVATDPVEPRDAARLLVVARDGDDPPDHRHVADLPDLLRPGDLLVFNTTRVLQARLVGRREDTGGGVEALYLAPGPDPGTWIAMVKARRFRPGAPIRLLDHDDRPADATISLVRRDEADPAAWVVRVERDGRPLLDPETLDLLAAIGRTPLPPYIRAARKAAHHAEEEPEDAEHYQTVYAAEAGSVAAPTAGLHFTPGLLDRLRERGVERADVVLHVGPGTFKPVETEIVEDHPMHAEWCSMCAAAIDAVTRARAEGRRVIGVGTTSVRTLEAFAADPTPGAMTTRILITPGHVWRWTDGMLTNFHLPRSTLMAMVGARLGGGVDRLKRLYAEAVAERYRFYSYGDAMLILP